MVKSVALAASRRYFFTIASVKYCAHTVCAPSDCTGTLRAMRGRVGASLFSISSLCFAFFFAEIWIYLRCHSALSDLADLDLSQRVSDWVSEWMHKITISHARALQHTVRTDASVGVMRSLFRFAPKRCNLPTQFSFQLLFRKSVVRSRILIVFLVVDGVGRSIFDFARTWRN